MFMYYLTYYKKRKNTWVIAKFPKHTKKQAQEIICSETPCQITTIRNTSIFCKSKEYGSHIGCSKWTYSNYCLFH